MADVLRLHGMDVVSIGNDVPLNIGDRIWLRFGWVTYFDYAKAAQWAIIDAQLKKRSEFDVIRTDYASDAKYLDILVEIKDSQIEVKDSSDPQQAGPVMVQITVAIIAAIVLGLTFFLTFEKALRVIGKPLLSGMSWAIGLLAGVTIYKLVTD